MKWGPLAGAWELALGRSRGMARFGDTPQAFLASLAPWIAFPLVYAAWAALSGAVVEAVTFMAMTVVAQLTPPVLSHWLAARWGQEAGWLRYATAYNWCQWAVSGVFLVLLVTVSIAVGLGASQQAAVGVFVVSFVAFCLWLSWSLARHGLTLSRGRSVLLVFLVNGLTFALVLGPQLLQLLLYGPPPG